MHDDPQLDQARRRRMRYAERKLREAQRRLSRAERSILHWSRILADLRQERKGFNLAYCSTVRLRNTPPRPVAMAWSSISRLS